jgi:uncharacterized membrane protein YgdD (TMEM256/DUF423 family)
MHKITVIWGVIFAALAVVFGAFGAHTLKSAISADALATFEVGVRYQMYHALAMLAIGLTGTLSVKFQKNIMLFFVVGTVLFSGSIYLLSLKEILPFDPGVIGFITPIGGTFFIIGWLYFLIQVIKLKSI